MCQSLPLLRPGLGHPVCSSGTASALHPFFPLPHDSALAPGEHPARAPTHPRALCAGFPGLVLTAIISNSSSGLSSSFQAGSSLLWLREPLYIFPFPAYRPVLWGAAESKEEAWVSGGGGEVKPPSLLAEQVLRSVCVSVGVCFRGWNR